MTHVQCMFSLFSVNNMKFFGRFFTTNDVNSFQKIKMHGESQMVHFKELMMAC